MLNLRKRRVAKRKLLDLLDINPQIAEVFNSCNKFIYVDNPPYMNVEDEEQEQVLYV